MFNVSNSDTDLISYAVYTFKYHYLCLPHFSASHLGLPLMLMSQFYQTPGINGMILIIVKLILNTTIFNIEKKYKLVYTWFAVIW